MPRRNRRLNEDGTQDTSEAAPHRQLGSLWMPGEVAPEPYYEEIRYGRERLRGEDGELLTTRAELLGQGRPYFDLTIDGSNTVDTLGPTTVLIEDAVVWMVGEEVVGSMNAEYDLDGLPPELHELALEAISRRQVVHVGPIADRLFPDRFEAPVPRPTGAPAPAPPEAEEAPTEDEEAA